MRRQMPQVREYMTRLPHTIQASDSLDRASILMQEYRIRHIPVQEGEKLVGILSDRAVKSAATSGWAHKLTVSDVMTGDPFTTAPNTPLDEVADTMAEEKFGCAIICDEGRLQGIFTTTDACRALRELLETVYPQP